MPKKQVIVVGAGFAGSVVARELAEQGKKVLLLEQRNHIGGNAYDLLDHAGVLVHRYGPHIFHTNNKGVFDYLSRFTTWHNYEHRVLANVKGTLMPVPFNETSLAMAFGKPWATPVIKKLRETYGEKTTILQLRQSKDPDLRQVAEYIYTHIFYEYTKKQWGLTPEELDPEVTGRVPIRISTDDRYFEDTYQGMPQEGYTKLFERMLDHQNISVELGVNGARRIEIKGSECFVDGARFDNPVVYTGAIDELFQFSYGRLPYRGVAFDFEVHRAIPFQATGTVNYTTDKSYTRITEFPHLTGQQGLSCTTIAKEYAYAYTGRTSEIPSYPIVNTHGQSLYLRYQRLAAPCKQLHLLGRLAQYRYDNMDTTVARALELSSKLCIL